MTVYHEGSCLERDREKKKSNRRDLNNLWMRNIKESFQFCLITISTQLWIYKANCYLASYD